MHFFHFITVRRRQRNNILKLMNNSDLWVLDEVEIAKCFMEFCNNLFTLVKSFDDVLNIVNCAITNNMNETLIALVSDYEIKHAAFQFAEAKA